jgi:predicted metalloprotease with PDZ domain
MTFFREDSEDGESYENSAAITSPDPFDSAGMIVTGNTLVHELLHHWIGGQIAPADHDSMAWFTEGFTEYYANVATARSATVPPALLLRKFNNQVSGYLYFFESPLFSGVALADASRKKGSYRFGVYNGGWALALFLDVRLRSETGGRRSLDDVMRLLYIRNGLAGKPLTDADFRAALSEVSGHDLGAVLDTYVDKRTELPIAETLAKLGLELRGQPYAADIFLIENPTAPPEALALRRSMFAF